MGREEMKPVEFVFDVTGDSHRASYTGVHKMVTATGARYVLRGPLAQAIQAMLDQQAARIAELEAERDETWTDERGVVWSRPTAWAYAKVCKARDSLQTRAEKAEAERDEILRQIKTEREVSSELIRRIEAERDAAEREWGLCEQQRVKAYTAGWIAGRDAAADLAESRDNGWDDDADMMARAIAADIRRHPSPPEPAP